MSPIFIVGCGRSGTTLLRVMLNKHSQIHIPEETWFFPNLDEELRSGKLERDPKFIAKRILELNPHHFPDLDILDLENTINGLDLSDISELVASVNIHYALKHNKAIWGDKTPGYVMHLDLIKKLYPNAKVIHLIRDPRDVVPSLLKYYSVGPQTKRWSTTIAYWKTHVEQGMMDGPKYFGNNYLEIRYEDLVQDSKVVLESIFSFLNLDYEAKILEYKVSSETVLKKWEWHGETLKPLNKDNIDKWKINLNARQLGLIELMAKSTMSKLKYSPSNKFSILSYLDCILERFRIVFIRFNNNLK
jgi:hypothetical protein